MRDVLEVPIEDSSSINPVSVLIVSDSSLKESSKQIECPKNQFRNDTFSDEVSICRICHGEEGDKDSVYEKEIDKLGEKSAGLAFITINSDRTQVSPASTNSGSLSTSNSLKSSSTDQMISQMCLISPCCCSGSLKYVHPKCLQQWIRSSGVDSCELCKQIFNMSVSYKPFYKWKSPDMSSAEKRKLFFNLLFNLVSMLCVFWSIYVLIERATFEAKYGLLDWPFWTKMLVVSIGFLGGSVFLFVQIRLYISIFLRWRQFNRIITIHNANNDDKSNDHKSDRSLEIGSNSVK